MVADHYWRTIRVPAATVRICRPPRLFATWGWGQNELHRTKRNVYKYNCMFLLEKQVIWRSVGRTEYEWGLDMFITNSRAATAAGCRQPSFLWHAFGKDTLLSGRLFSLWNSINQSTNIKVGHRMQVIQHSLTRDGSALHVSDLP